MRFSRYKIIVLLLLALATSTQLKAQSAMVICEFTADTVVTGYGQTFTNKLKLENKSAQPIVLTKAISSEIGLLSLPDTLLLTPGAVKYIPVKYLSSETIFSKPLKAIEIKYTEQVTGSSVNASFIARLDQPDKIVMYVPESIVYLNKAGGLARFKVRLLNKGYAATNLQLKLTANPVGLQLLTPVKALTLEPGNEQLVEFEAGLLDGRPNYSPDFNVIIEATDLKNVNVATATIHITSLESNKRQNISAGQYTDQLANTSELGFASVNNLYSYYMARTNGNVILGSNSNLSYNINANFYDKQNGLEAYDTWVNYSNKSFGIKAGTLMENLDYSLYGRGLKTSVSVGKHSSFDAYYVRNSYFLFSQINREVLGTSTFAGSYNYKGQSVVGKVNVLYSTNPSTGIDTRFVNGSARFKLGANQFINIKGGYSNEQGFTQTKAGAAAGFVYNLRSKLIDINLNNYYSTPYYSGLQRGSVLLDNQVNIHFGNHAGIFAHYEQIKNSPQYLRDTLSVTNFYNNTLKYEAGLNLNFKKLNITLHPYLLKQDINQGFISSYNLAVQNQLSSSATRVGLDLNYAIKPGQQLMIISDMGLVKSNNTLLPKQNYTSLKINMNYFNKWWGLNAMIQNGPYYLSEEVVVTSVSKNYQVYSIGPNIHFSAFKNRLNVSVNDYLNLATYNTANNNSLNATASYKFKQGWQLNGQVYYNTYSGYTNTTNLQSRLTVGKQFTQTNTPGLKDLEMNFFEDANNDGLCNNNEKPVDALIIGLITNDVSSNNNLTTVTDKKGTVKYSNLKPGNYDLAIVSGNGLHMATPLSFNIIKDEKRVIPLVRSGRLKGQIIPIEQEYVKTKPLLEGLKIIATDTRNQTFTTLANEAGEFSFSLPASNYRITVVIANQKYIINNPDQLVAVNLKDNEEVQFNLIDETRKAIVRQF